MTTNDTFFVASLLSKLLDRHGSVVITRRNDLDKGTSVDRVELGAPIDDLFGKGMHDYNCGHDNRQVKQAKADVLAIDLTRMFATLVDQTAPEPRVAELAPMEPPADVVDGEPDEEEELDHGTPPAGTTYGDDPSTDIDHGDGEADTNQTEGS